MTLAPVLIRQQVGICGDLPGCVMNAYILEGGEQCLEALRADNFSGVPDTQLAAGWDLSGSIEVE